MKHLKWLIPVFIIAFCFLGFLIAPNDPEAMDIVNKYAAPSVDFPLGTDQFGRCELSRLLYGGKVTLGIVLLGGSIVLVLGTLIGLWLGRTGKRRQKSGVQQPVGRGDSHPAAGIPDYLRGHLGQ